MTTLDFFVAWGTAFFVLEVATRILAPLLLREAKQQMQEWVGGAQEVATRSFPIIAQGLFALIFAFLLFQHSDKAGEIGVWSGSLYGLFMGVIVYVPRALQQTAVSIKLQHFELRAAMVGIIASLLAGIALSFLM